MVETLDERGTPEERVRLLVCAADADRHLEGDFKYYLDDARDVQTLLDEGADVPVCREQIGGMWITELRFRGRTFVWCTANRPSLPRRAC